MTQVWKEFLGIDQMIYAFGWIPVPVFINNKPLLGAEACQFLIFTWINVKPKYFTDQGLILHEQEHCEDIYRYGLIGYALLYKFSAKWRLFFELKAYVRQYVEYKTNRPTFVADDRVFDILARYIARYDVGLPLEIIKAKFRYAIAEAIE